MTLQGADQGDTTTLDVTLCEAGEAVAELVLREVEQRPDEKLKVSVNGIEEMVADKGYHSGAAVERVKSYRVRSYIPERQQKGGATGKARPHSSKQCTRTGAGCASRDALDEAVALGRGQIMLMLDSKQYEAVSRKW